jgi:hypothetical protein
MVVLQQLPNKILIYQVILVGPDIVYLLSNRMRFGHDFLTHFTQYSQFENTNCHQLSGIK